MWGQGHEHPCPLGVPCSTLGTNFYSTTYKQCDMEQVPLSVKGSAGGLSHSARERHLVLVGVLLPQAAPSLPHTLSPEKLLRASETSHSSVGSSLLLRCTGPWWQLT